MTLRVPFDQFPATVKRLLPKAEAYLSPRSAGTLVSAANIEKSLLILCLSNVSIEATREKLSEAKIECFDGLWADGDELPSEAAPAFIAAVAYKSGEDRPGLWVDASPTMPTPVQVLRAMYDEFRQTGEVGDVAFEEFARLAEANVVVLTPDEIAGYVANKDC